MSNISSVYASLRNSMRISGIASGLDTDTMVANLMKVERMRYEQVEQKKTKVEWTSQANDEVNGWIREFRDSYFSSLGKFNMVSSGSVNRRMVTMDAVGSGVTVTADRNAVLGTHTVQVAALASGANASAVIGDATLITGTALNALPLSEPLTFEDGVLSFAINGQTFSFNETDTLQTVLNRVNSNAMANVSMAYNSLNGTLSVKSKALGIGSELSIENLKGNAFTDTNAAFGIAQGTWTNGTNANVTIDGVSTEMESNRFAINGMTFNLTAVTAGPVGFAVDNDVESSVTAIKEFVNAYNTLIGKLNGKLSEKYDRDYPPLTDSQREAMSEDEVTKWEAKAKTGLLQNNSYIAGLLQNMRSAFYETVESVGLNPSSIGLNTGAYYTKGQIVIDEGRLRDALANNPDAVAALFSSVSTETDPSVARAQSGLAVRMQTAISNYMNDYNKQRKTSTDQQLRNFDRNLARLEDQLIDIENRYWRQFTAMETALSQLNSQSSWLSNAFSSSY